MYLWVVGAVLAVGLSKQTSVNIFTPMRSVLDLTQSAHAADRVHARKHEENVEA